jgi:hypothetical protein
VKKQVIFNILDKLESRKKENQGFLKRIKGTLHDRGIWRGRIEAFEMSIEMVLKEADILDSRPANE